MNQEAIQQAAREEALVPKADRVKISSTNIRIDPTMTPKEGTYQVILDVIKNTSFYKAFLASADVPEIYMQQFWHTVSKALNICPRVPGKKFSVPPSEEELLTFLIGLSYKGKYVDFAELIWEDFSYQIDNMQLKKSRREIMPYPIFTKIIINHFLSIHKSVPKALPSSLHTIKDDGVLSRMKFVRIEKDVQEYGRAIPDAMLIDNIKQSETYQMFIKYSTGLITLKKTRGKGLQGKKAAVSPKPASVEVSDESDSEPARKRTSSKRVIKKKVSISARDNIISEPDVTLESGKSMSLTEATEEEATRQVHATHELIVTKSDSETARRRPSGIAFRDTSSVSKKMSPDPSQKLKGVQTLTPEEQLAADTMQALKASRKSTRSQPHARGSSEGTGTKPGVPDESTVILKTLSDGTGAKPGIPDEEKDTSEAKTDIDWVYSDEEEEKKDDDDDDKSIDIEETGDEETDDEFVRGDEYVRDDVDKEIKDAEVAESGNSDEEITYTAKADAEKTKEVKDDNKKVELPLSSSSLSVSSGFGNQFLNLSSDKSTVRNLKDIADAEINSLLDVQIQQEIPHIQSPSILTVPISVIFDPAVLSPISEIPTVTSTTTPPPPHYSILEKDVQELKEADHTTTHLGSLRSEIPSAVNAYLRSSLGDAFQKVLHQNTKELIQQYPHQVNYKDVIEESIQANVINKVKNLLPKFLPKAISDFATPVIQSNVNKALEKTLIVVAQSSSQAQYSLKAAESLSEYELKTILFENMDKSCSYLTRDKHQALFDVLFNSLCLDDVITRGKKTKRRRTKESESSKKTSATQETSKGNASTKGSKSNKFVHAKESVVEPTEEVIMDASNDDVVNDVDQPQNEPAPKHSWFTQPPRPPTPDPE
ncbi:hypothetical protein Tco_1303266 [Tanacetum coccineum]